MLRSSTNNNRWKRDNPNTASTPLRRTISRTTSTSGAVGVGGTNGYHSPSHYKKAFCLCGLLSTLSILYWYILSQVFSIYKLSAGNASTPPTVAASPALPSVTNRDGGNAMQKPLLQESSSSSTVTDLHEKPPQSNVPSANFSPPLDAPSSKEKKATIAYLTSVTGCPSQKMDKFVDAAAVLQHSIHRASQQSIYDYAMYAIIHPVAAECCADAFAQLGYSVLIRDTPFALSEIRNEKYVQRLTNPNAVCCQE